MKYLKLLKNKNFSFLWFGQICSGFGSWVYSIALLVFISKLRFSGMAVSGLMIARMLPFILVGPLIGNYIDGKKRKQVMISSDVVRFFLTIIIVPLLYVNKETLSTNIVIFIVYIVSMLSALAGTFFSPSRKAIMPLILDEDDLKTANSLMSMSRSLTLILGPAFGGLLVTLLGLAGVFWLNAATFLFSALCILIIKVNENIEESQKNYDSLMTKYFKGWQVIKQNSEIAYYIYVGAVRSLVVGVINISFIFVAKNIFPTGREAVGWLYSALGLGVILGSLLIGTLELKVKDRKLYLIVVLINAVLSIFYINTSLWYLAIIMLFIIGLSDGFQMVIFNTSIQKSFNNKSLGKVFASANALIMSVQLISMGVGGGFFDLVGYKPIVYGASLITILFSIVWFIALKKNIDKSVESNMA